MSSSVMAIVLTYDSPATLRGCVDALLGQSRPPDQILVVDNAGPQPACEAVCPEKGVVVVRLPENLGPAGGWSFGFAEFLRQGHSFAWVMDDDIVPASDCLQRLVAAAATDPAGSFLWPRQLDASGTVRNHPGWYGFLVSREIVLAAGLPRAELVWWAEDTEYLQWRIPAHGFPSRRVPGASVVHLEARPERIVPGWKLYYQVRNSIYYRSHVQRLRHPLKLARVVAWGGVNALRGSGQGRRVTLLLRAVFDGFAARLGMRVGIGAGRG